MFPLDGIIEPSTKTHTHTRQLPLDSTIARIKSATQWL
jgi:hypothetical protein